MAGNDSDRPESGEEEFLRLSRELRALELQRPQEPKWQPPTEAEFNSDWITVEDALEGLGHRLEGLTKRREIMELLKAGMVLAVARSGQPQPKNDAMQQFVPVPAKLWDSWTLGGEDHFWNTGQAIFKVYVPDSGALLGGHDHPQRFFDVRFDPEGFSGRPPRFLPPEPKIAAPTVTEPAAEMAGFIGPRLQDGGPVAPATAPPAEPPVPSPKPRVGRPSKEYWEELLIEMMRQIWVGDLKPRRQADVQHAMAEWIVERGYGEPPPTTLKERARLIYQVFENEQ